MGQGLSSVHATRQKEIMKVIMKVITHSVSLLIGVIDVFID
jgi:hypothetical protein